MRYLISPYRMTNYARWPQMSAPPEASTGRDDAGLAWLQSWGFIHKAPAEVQSLPLDLYETGDAVVVTASLPGLTAEDIELTVQDGILRIQGELKQEQVPDGQFLRQERCFGRFDREVTLPTNVQVDAVEARVDNGILTLRLPKMEAAKMHRIMIQDVARPQIAAPAA